MKSLMSLLSFLTILSFFSTDLLAQTKLSVQGVIRKSDGNAVDDGLYEITFKLYDTITSGSLLWTEVQPQVKVTSGIYSTILGVVTPLNLPFDQFYFLSLTIDGEELLPRAPLTSAPYANSLIGFDNTFPSSGNVGIGTASPASKLDVVGNTKITGNLAINSNVLFTDNDNVGIGTSSPDNNFKLHVNGNIKANNMLSAEAFHATLTNAADFTSSNSTLATNLKYTSVEQNTNTSVFSMNSSTGVLTILKAGVINLSAQFDFLCSSGWIPMNIVVNNIIRTRPLGNCAGATEWNIVQGHLIWRVNANDQIKIESYPNGISNIDQGWYSTLSVQWTGVN